MGTRNQPNNGFKKNELVQLALNPFLHNTSKTRNSGFRLPDLSLMWAPFPRLQYLLLLTLRCMLGISKKISCWLRFFTTLGCEFGYLMGTHRTTQKPYGMFTYFADCCWFSAICPWQSSQHQNKHAIRKITKHSIWLLSDSGCAQWMSVSTDLRGKKSELTPNILSHLRYSLSSSFSLNFLDMNS